MTKNRPLSELIIDPVGRPEAAPLPGLTQEHRARGRQLAVIHRHHLMELARVRRVLNAIDAQIEDPATLQDAISAMEMTRNFRSFGTLCGQECRMLTFHHDAEESHIFPVLDAKGNAEIRAIVARLREEHVVVHALIERLFNNAVDLSNAPTKSNFTAARDTFTALESAVVSHFGYEETQLADAIGLHIDQI